MNYKITQSQLQNGTFVDKWYIRPEGAMLCCDKDVVKFFNCTIDEFMIAIRLFNGGIHHYRSWFCSKETAEQAAILLKNNLDELKLMYSLAKAADNL